MLTVQEIMMVAARLKLPSHTSEKHRLDTVIIIIIIIIIINSNRLKLHPNTFIRGVVNKFPD